MKGHKLTIETKPGRSGDPLLQRWGCTCGASSGKGWIPYDRAQNESDNHATAVTRTAKDDE